EQIAGGGGGAGGLDRRAPPRIGQGTPPEAQRPHDPPPWSWSRRLQATLRAPSPESNRRRQQGEGGRAGKTDRRLAHGGRNQEGRPMPVAVPVLAFVAGPP